MNDSDFLIWQYRGKPRAKSTVELLLSESGKVFKSAIEVGNALNIETAKGYALDLVGRHVGVSRTLTAYLKKDYFGWLETEGALGFGKGEWYQYGNAINDSVVLNDDDYRFLIKTKILKNYQQADIGDLVEHVNFLFGEKANVIDNYNMTLTALIPLEKLNQFKIYAVMNLDALRRPIGVKYNFFKKPSHYFGWYEDKSAFGFDDGKWGDFI